MSRSRRARKLGILRNGVYTLGNIDQRLARIVIALEALATKESSK